jgi:phage major head subunit gpT-like protein
MKQLSIPAFMRLKANGAGKPKRFSILAYSGGLLPVDGFAHSVVVDLSGLETPGSIPILIDHTKSVEATLGLTDNIHNDGAKLTLSGVVTGQSQMALQVLAQSAAGHTWQASIGAMVIESEDIPAGQTATANGQTFVGPVIIARRSVLRETSVLPMGADSTTSVNLAASARRFLKGSAAMSFEDFITSLGLDAATLTPEAAAVLQTAFAATQAPPAAPVAAAPVAPVVPPAITPTAAAGVKSMDIEASLAENRKQIAAQFRKAAEIQAMAAGHPVIAAKAIEDNWSIEKVELEVIKAKAIGDKTRPTSFRSAQNAPENQAQVLEAALCVARNLRNNGRKPGVVEIDKQYPDQILQAAHTQFRNQIGLQQLIMIAAAQGGMPMSAGDKITTGNIRQVLAYACPQNIEAAFSTLSLPGILSTVANKEILQGYMEEDNTWKEIAQTKSATDFKTITSYRMLDDMAYEQLGPGGVIKHGKTGEESFTRSVDTYAKMYSITRQDIINDDLGAFDDLRSRIGMGAAMKLNDLFWTTFLANLGTIFTSGRTNYISGATTNLGTDGVGLGLGQKAWRQRTTAAADGAKRLSGTASFLLVPPELEVIADSLYAARNINAVKVSDSNTFANKYTPIVANQLSDSTFTGYSTTAWYMLGDKSKGSPVVVSFLNGQETPTVESADADFNTLGIQFRGYHDFGCDLGDGYLNALMSKGAA